MRPSLLFLCLSLLVLVDSTEANEKPIFEENTNEERISALLDKTIEKNQQLYDGIKRHLQFCAALFVRPEKSKALISKELYPYARHVNQSKEVNSHEYLRSNLTLLINKLGTALHQNALVAKDINDLQWKYYGVFDGKLHQTPVLSRSELEENNQTNLSTIIQIGLRETAKEIRRTSKILRKGFAFQKLQASRGEFDDFDEILKQRSLIPF